MKDLFVRRSFSYRSGDEIAGFRIISAAGRGGAGEVYLAEDASGKRFALKISSGNCELPGMTASRSLPANDLLVTIHAVGRLPDGRIYTLMEAADDRGDGKSYIPDTLSERIRHAPLKTPEALAILLRLLAAVRVLHEHRLVHGDIKPENVLFCSGKAKLSDFGTLGEAGEYAGGTMDFLPPEFFARDGAFTASPANDLYALGKLLYCIWSGRSPAEYPTPPESADPAEFRLIRPLYAKACHRQAAFRFHSAAEMYAAVEAALKKTERRTFPRRRMRLLFCAVILLLIGAGSLFFCARQHSVPQPLSFAERRYCTRQSADLAELLALCGADAEMAAIIRRRQSEIAAAAVDKAFFSRLPAEEPAIAAFRKKMLDSPELYLTSEIVQEVRQIVATAPHTPPLPIYGTISFFWSRILDECRYHRVDLAGRKKLAEELRKAVQQLKDDQLRQTE